MNDLVNISLPTAGGYAILGYCVVFFGLILLMCVVMIMCKIMTRNANAAASAAQPVPGGELTPAAPAAEAKKAPGTAGEFKLFNTDLRDAAMVMAIVADSLGKPINELRFISIREVKEDEV
jgi:Na+-transporting methylmalonyl-CoA/oxaloacetate decarboxylase gamma subunit